MKTVVSRMKSNLLHHRWLLLSKSVSLFFFLMVVLSMMAQKEPVSSCPQQKIDAVRLPDLNVPRGGHCAFFANGEVVLVGGHTTGFVPTATAEYLKDGKWHLMKTAYEHDDGFGVVLKSGKVLIAGGHEKSLGIGQTFPVEYYDPVDHSFEGFGCLDKKRALAQVLEMDNGNVIIAGNWYHTDGIEIFDGKASFTLVNDIDSGMVKPYIFQTSADDAVVFGDQNNYGKRRRNLAYRVKGKPFSVPLFDEWHPYMCFERKSDSESFVGDRQKGVYAYLFPVKNDDGQYAIAKMNSVKGQSAPDFSLLPAKHSIPAKSQWGKEIFYSSSIMVDQNTGKGYLTGFDKEGRCYVLCINNVRAEKDINYTLYYTDPLEDAGCATPVLTDDGNIVIAGGITDSNFYPKSSAYMLCLSGKNAAFTRSAGYLPWIVLGALLLLAAVLYKVLFRKKQEEAPVEEPSDASDDNETEKHLVQRICTLMDTEQPYLLSDLKLSDVSAMLSTNSRYVSEAIKNQRGCSFTQFVNGYRVEYAKKMLLSQPDRKMTEVISASGFSGESSFFRIFKSFTGLTPGEWIAQNNKGEA